MRARVWTLALLLFAAPLVLALMAAARRGWLLSHSSGPLPWPGIESCALQLDLRTPGRFSALAALELTAVEGARVALLLDRDLEVERATVEGGAVAIERELRLSGRYFSEARVLLLDLGNPPADGRLRLELEYGGPAAQGSAGNDWRGILYVGAGEARMSEQTAFYPQVPLALDGPRVARCRFDLTVLAPAGWEVFAPLEPQGVDEEREGARRWRFRGARPQVLSVLAGERARRELRQGGTRIVTLLLEEHAELGVELEHEALAALEAFAARFGAIDAGVLGIVEICCRDDSYNWASEGVIAFDRWALGGEVPVATLAHEVAHLWWGQAAPATGAGERFLTEGLAEYSAWLHLAQRDPGAVRSKRAQARRQIEELAAQGRSAALAGVQFDSRNYQVLAYEKGPVVLDALAGQLGQETLERALAKLVRLGAQRPVTLEDFEAALREASGLAELAPCWLRQAGDLDLALESFVELPDGGRRLVLRAEPLGGLDPRGTPVALLLGDGGGRERRTVLLAGERTELTLAPAKPGPAFARIDPDGGWPRVIERRTAVIGGGEIVASEPAAGTRPGHGGTRVVLELDRALQPPELAALAAAQLGGSEGALPLSVLAARLEDGGRRLVVETAPWLPDTGYRLELAPLEDLEGLPLARSGFVFRTAASEDRDPPRIGRFDPPSGATVAPGELMLTVEFDEPMLLGRGFHGSAIRRLEAQGLAKPTLAGNGEWSGDGRQLRYRLVGLEDGRSYALPFGPNFRDLSSNRLEERVWTIEVGEPAQGGR